MMVTVRAGNLNRHQVLAAVLAKNQLASYRGFSPIQQSPPQLGEVALHSHDLERRLALRESARHTRVRK